METEMIAKTFSPEAKDGTTPAPTLRDRLEAMIVGRPDRCWVVIGKRGQETEWLWIEGRSVYARRVAYEVFERPLQPGEKLVATCGHRACVNPAHMEPKNPSDQGRAAVARRWSAEKTHCVNGHAYTPENTLFIGPDKAWRRCRICRNESARRKRRERKAAQGFENK